MTDLPSDPEHCDSQAEAEQAMAWFIRMRAESVTQAERMQFRIWYQASARHRRLFDETAAFWEDAGLAEALAKTAFSSPAKAHSGMRRFSLALLALAAGFALVAIIYRPYLNCLQTDYCTAIGEIKTVSLPDGSQITLNSASAISLDFNQGSRHVRLENGEAFFDVQRDPLHPFIVEALYSRTQVLGTRFAVREDSGGDSVSVISGVVQVSGGERQPAVLHANDSITLDSKRSSEIRQITATTAVAWLKGGAAFDNAPLVEVVAELGRYRRGNILIRKASLKNLKVSGRFDITDTDKALESLQQTLPIRVYRLSPWLVVIT